MIRLHVRTFGGKLLVSMLLVSAIAASFVCISLVLRHAAVARRSTLATLETHSDILRTHSVAAMRFGDPEAGAETLAALKAIPAIRRAELLLPDGREFAVYEGVQAAAARPSNHGRAADDAMAALDGHSFLGRTLILSRPVVHDGDVLGTLRLNYDMSHTYDGIRTDIAIAGAMALMAMGLALAIGLHLRKTLARPIRELVGVARSVAEHRDYSRRAVHDRNDDLGEVMDVFNSMLATIELRQTELQRAHDQLEHRVAERTSELAAAKARAEEASRSKSDFLANMSHEIRTPMTAILGFGEMLEDPNRSASQQLECVQTIRRNGLHLLGLINDILDISKIEAGRMTIETNRTSLLQIVGDVESLTRLRAAEKDLTLRVEYEGPIPETIETDPTRLRQILVNLLGNAVKFTEKGEVTLRITLDVAATTSQSAERSASTAAATMLRFDVRDTGIGLTEEQIAGLFKPFAQADESVTRRFGGTGLGLTISKQLAQLLGGDVTVTSEIGRGSTFTVTIRTGSLENVRMLTGPSAVEAELREMRRSSTSPEAAATLPRLRGRVLLAEDGYDNQRLIKAILTAAGAQVTVVENGLLACEEIARSESADEPYDLIFMDMQMPEMDGYTAATELRRLGCRLSIVALTAHALTGDSARCIEAGCDAYLSKPVDRRKLVETAAKFMPYEIAPTSPHRRGADAAPTGTSGAAAGEALPLESEMASDSSMTELIANFVRALPERIHELERAAAAQDFTALAALSRRLSGAGSGYGYPAVGEAAKSLEQLAQAADPEIKREPAAMGACIDELKSIASRASLALAGEKAEANSDSASRAPR